MVSINIAGIHSEARSQNGLLSFFQTAINLIFVDQQQLILMDFSGIDKMSRSVINAIFPYPFALGIVNDNVLKEDIKFS